MTACAGCDAPLPPSRSNRPRKWCSERCRKVTLYSRRCLDCGATINTDGRVARAAERCGTCAAAHSRAMTQRWVIESMQEWAEMFGAPPSATDWNQHMCRDKGMHWKVRRYQRTGRVWPSVNSVQDNFGSWNEGLRAAGFAPMNPRDYPLGRHGEALRNEERAA